MDKKIDDIIRKFISAVAKNNMGLITTYVFGSYAKNKERIESDIDIALILEDIPDNNKFDLQVQLLLMASQFDFRIEPHPFSKQDFISDNPFAMEIKRTGIEIAI